MILSYLKNMIEKFLTYFKNTNKDVPFQKRIDYQLDDTPDQPLGFGYKTAWLAIKDTNIDKIIQDLNIKVIGKANWESGFNAVLRRRAIFITPQINGWSFVIGLYLYDVNKFVSTISKSIPNFYYFFTERVSETHIWISVKDKVIQRAFGYCGGGDGLLFDYGDYTVEEISLGLQFEELKNYEGDYDDVKFPNEDDVIAISEAWTMNTLDIDDLDLEKSTGVVGIFDYKHFS